MSSPIPTHRPDYFLEVLDNEILLYHPSRAIILRLNQTAAIIWQLCDGNRSESEITELLIDAFPSYSVEIVRETGETLERFHRHGIIDVV